MPHGRLTQPGGVNEAYSGRRVIGSLILLALYRVITGKHRHA
ncbi:hypothetical protein [Streptomyces sp. M41(2017)]|nr:hypothetical protein [Streptomyces sp. M41(2017)]